MHSVIVIGGNHHNTLGVIRSLGEKGLHPSVILVDTYCGSFVGKSKYIHNVYFSSDDDTTFLILMKLKKKPKQVIIACSDAIASFIDRYRYQLIDFYYLPGVPKEGELTKLMDKEKMSTVAASFGLVSPQFIIASNGDSLDRVIFPCICKPTSSLIGSKTDIHICNDIASLRDRLQVSDCKSFQIQQYIYHNFEFQLIGLSLKEGNEVIIPGRSICIRPCPGTNTGYLRYEYDTCQEELITKCKAFLKGIHYSGLFSIEFLHGNDGRDYFMEINFRNDGNAISVTASGINLPYIWYLSSINSDYSPETSSKRKTVYIMPEFMDFSYFVITKKIGLLRWIKEALRVDRFTVFCRKDPKPFFVYLIWIFKKKCNL